MDDPGTAERGASNDSSGHQQTGDYQLDPKQEQRDHDHRYDYGCHYADGQHLKALEIANIDSGNGERVVQGLL